MSTIFNSQTFSSSVILSNAVTNNVPSVTVSGSISGSITYTQPECGSACKKVIVYCNALAGTASVTFSVAFTNVPTIISTNGLSSSLVTTLNATGAVITGATSTGFIIIEGF